MMNDQEFDAAGGPASPVAFPNYFRPGMTIRDYFAGQALIAFTKDACEHSFTFDEVTKESGYVVDTDEIARLSYAFADAMLKERERK